VSRSDGVDPVAGTAQTAGIVALSVLVAAAVVTTWLAWIGHLRATVLFPVWAALAVALIMLARPIPIRGPWRRPHAAILIATAVIALFTALNVVSAGQHVATDRDPGVYVVAARWLARTGETSAPGVAGTPFATVPGIRAGSSGFADLAGDGRQVELIQAPGLSAMLATAQIAAGDRAMFVLLPLMAGLALAFFAALAMRLAGPWFGLVATSALAASLAEAYVARDAFAEVPTQALAIGGLWALAVALAAGHRGRAVLAGAALGSTVAIHFPALTLIAGLLLAATLETWLGEEDDIGRRRVACYTTALLVAVPLAAAGILGLRYWNYPYAHAHRSFIRDFIALIVVLGGLWLLGLARRRFRGAVAADAATRGRLGRVAAILVAAAALYGLLLRPSVERAHDPVLIPEAVANLQNAAGVAIEPSRSYAEMTLRWLVDYMGVVAAVLGLAGLAIACLHAVRPRAVLLRILLPPALIAATVYALRPAAFPDQPWIIRRFVPEVIPLLLVFAAWLLQRLWQASVPAPRVIRVAVLVAAALVVVAPLAVLRPLARANAGERNLDAVHALCKGIGDDSAVLFGGGRPGSAWYPETIQAFCGAPTASLDDPNPRALHSLAAAWAARGRRLVLVTNSPSSLARWGVPTTAGTTIFVANPHALALTINRPPDAYRPTSLRFTYAPVAP
jgi:hypothetical protein